MEKIPTIFERDWDGNRGVIDQPSHEFAVLPLSARNHIVATEKLDGTNVRLTVRSETLVRIEKRRNPSKGEKAIGIEDPWYADVAYQDPADQHIIAAAENTDLAGIPDGEWAGEAIGPKIQGNPLDLTEPTVVLFSCGKAPVVDPPLRFDWLRTWLPAQRSALNPERPIEGVVWHYVPFDLREERHPVGKLKTADFK